MTARAGGAPIRVRCEGSLCPPANRPSAQFLTPLCSMCGREFSGQGRKANRRYKDAWRSIPMHYRDDVLAMLERGDFG